MNPRIKRPTDDSRPFLKGWFVGFAASSWFLAWLGWQWLLNTLPLPTGLFTPSPQGLEFLDRHGQRLRSVLSTTSQQFGFNATESELPRVLVDATLAAEDARFQEHHGVDFLAIARAIQQSVKHGRIVSGASTITQQLVKLASRPRGRRDWLRKGMEALQARRLEEVWSKEQILAAYINRLNYGNLNQGVHAAAWNYFQKSPANLSLAEAAFLAAIPQSPSRLNPRRNFPATKARQEWILSRLESLRWIDPVEYQRALSEPIRLAPVAREFLAPHFVDWILQLPGYPDSGVHTTSLDLALNQRCQQILHQHLASLQEQRVRDGAIVILDNRDSSVLAMVGARDYFDPASGQVNGANSPRSAGSTLKPFVYRMALEDGAFPGTLLADVPVEYQTATGLFRPQNYSRVCYGPLSLRQALANSLNIPAVRLLDSLGGANRLHAELTQLGFSTLTESPDHYGLGLTLGNAGVTLIELANAYATLARLGESQPIRWQLQDPAPSAPPAPSSPLDPTASLRRRESCWLIADILSDNTARALEFGLDSPLHFDFPVACKTGTSTGYRDNWAVGFTPEFTVAVWVGNFNGSPMQSVSGITGAAPILHDLFMLLKSSHGTSWYAPLPSLVQSPIDPDSGKRHRTVSNQKPIRLEWSSASTLPPFEEPSDRDAAGRFILDEGFQDWYSTANATTRRRFVVARAADTPLFRVLSPLDGTHYFVDGDMPPGAQRIDLRASRPCVWTSDSLRCLNQDSSAQVELAPGRHRLVARDELTGAEVEHWIQVDRL